MQLNRIPLVPPSGMTLKNYTNSVATRSCICSCKPWYVLIYNDPINSPHSPPPPLHDVIIDLGVEEDEETKRDDPEDEQPAPVVVGRVDGVGAQLGYFQVNLVSEKGFKRFEWINEWMNEYIFGIVRTVLLAYMAIYIL